MSSEEVSVKCEQNSDGETSTSEKIVFKRKRRRNLRQRDVLPEEENVETLSNKLIEAKELQNLRKKPHGISLMGLALGQKLTTEEEAASSDPFRVKFGGMLNMQALKSGKIKEVDDAYDSGIGTQFSVETNKRDEDEEMMKYIEEQLVKRKCNNGDESKVDETNVEEKQTPKYLSPEEAALQAVPTHLRESSMRKNEEMLSNQMLNGIPEIDLGIEAKIKNIEATEEAKLKLLFDQNNKKDTPSQFVPTNMAVNFVQHNRFNVDFSEAAKKKQKIEAKQEEKGKLKKESKATDDYHYEKFKKQFRRH